MDPLVAEFENAQMKQLLAVPCLASILDLQARAKESAKHFGPEFVAVKVGRSERA
jgi:hypothetical protein